MTGSDEGPEDQEKRSPRRGMNREEENEPAAERSYSELLDRIRATDERYAELLDELRSLSEPRPFAGGRGTRSTTETTLSNSESGLVPLRFPALALADYRTDFRLGCLGRPRRSRMAAMEASSRCRILGPT